jgi:DNA-binding MarR family transcriptional regulator
MSLEDKSVTLRQYQALAEFRYELRRFLRYSEQITRRHRLTTLQYQLLLQIKGFPKRKRPTVGELAERLQAKHHGAVALVTRCARAGLVRRHASAGDRRAVVVELTRKGARVLERLARLHRDELKTIRRRLTLWSSTRGLL